MVNKFGHHHQQQHQHQSHRNHQLQQPHHLFSDASSSSNTSSPTGNSNATTGTIIMPHSLPPPSSSSSSFFIRDILSNHEWVPKIYNRFLSLCLSLTRSFSGFVCLISGNLLWSDQPNKHTTIPLPKTTTTPTQTLLMVLSSLLLHTWLCLDLTIILSPPKVMVLLHLLQLQHLLRLQQPLQCQLQQLDFLS